VLVVPGQHAICGMCACSGGVDGTTTDTFVTVVGSDLDFRIDTVAS
jgi:hypothetical protein